MLDTDPGVVPGSLRFAPDGRTLAWTSSRRSADGDALVRVRVADAAFGPYDDVAPPGVLFSPSSRPAWVARLGPRWALYAEGRRLATFDELLPGTHPTWLDDGSLAFVALRTHRAAALPPARTIVAVRSRAPPQDGRRFAR
jgi:WD40 repeat protein